MGTHTSGKWRSREDLHCVNLPTTAYVFRPGEPTGWVDAFLSETGIALELRCLDNTHLKNREKHDLIWRV